MSFLLERSLLRSASRAALSSSRRRLTRTSLQAQTLLRRNPAIVGVVGRVKAFSSSAAYQMPTMASDPKQFMRTSGHNDPVWIHTEPYSNRPQFSPLKENLETDVCIIGSGISGISIAEQLVRRGLNVVMIEARDILSGTYFDYLLTAVEVNDNICRRDRTNFRPSIF